MRGEGTAVWRGEWEEAEKEKYRQITTRNSQGGSLWRQKGRKMLILNERKAAERRPGQSKQPGQSEAVTDQEPTTSGKVYVTLKGNSLPQSVQSRDFNKSWTGDNEGYRGGKIH